jgi:equilibrative nucleoside transporter 1/2/3
MGPNVRFVSGVVVMVSVFACTSALTQFMDMDPTLFFALTLVSVVLSAMATGCMSAVFALSAMHSPQYVQAVNSGQGIAGLIPSLSNFILQFYINENEENRDAMKNRAFVFFMITVSIGILTLLSHLILTFKLKKREPSISTSESIESGINPIIVTEEANLKPIFSFAVAIFFNFAVTLMLFPAITARVSPMDDYPTHGWIKNLFLAIHFLSKFMNELIQLVFNIADLVGKSIPGVSWFHIQNKTRLLLFSYGRVVFVLLFLLCNVTIVRSNGDPLFPTYLGDTSFMLILFIFGMTSGWVSTNLLMEGPQTVPVSKREKAVNIMVFSLTAGLATGSLLSFMLKGILCQCNPFTSE